MEGVWAEDYEEDDDFLANYGEAIEVPEPGQKSKKAKLIDPEEAEKAPKRLTLKPREPRPKLDCDRLLEENDGLPRLLNMARDITFKEGQEIRDLKRTVGLMKLWAHRCFPKYTLEDFIMKCDKLGSKRQIKTHLRKVRLNMIAVNSAEPPEPQEFNPTEFVPSPSDYRPIDRFESPSFSEPETAETQSEPLRAELISEPEPTGIEAELTRTEPQETQPTPPSADGPDSPV